MNFWQNLIYGLIAGFAEFTPVSSGGHQALLRKIFGIQHSNPFLELMVHLGLLAAVIVSCRIALVGYAREMGILNNRRGRRGATNLRRTYEMRFLMYASVPMLLMLVFCNIGSRLTDNSLLLCLFFLLNGIVLYIVDHLPHGNKDASRMSGLDAVFTGLMSGLSIIPGISRLGMGLSFAIGRGADKSQAYSWTLCLCVPALILLSFLDFLGILTVSGISYSLLSLAGYLVAGLGAFGGGYLMIMVMRLMLSNTGFAGYACYCWGLSVFTFILYLIA